MNRKNRIAILSTLHHFHNRYDFYTFDDLEDIILKINPDIICAELTKEELDEKKQLQIKLEYPECIIPLSEENNIEMVPIEPEEPDYSELVNTRIHIEKKLKEEEPDKYETFELFVQEWFKVLIKNWNSYKDVNSKLSDIFCEMKHNFQGELFGNENKEMWESWNQHFLEAIKQVDEEKNEKRILVTVGFEHGYWLRDKLANELPQNLIE